MINNWKFWAVLFAIFLALGILFLNSKTGQEKVLTPQKPVALQVETAPTQPVTTRIGVNITGEVPNLKALRPAWLRQQPTAEFLELSRDVQANPWLVVSSTLSDEELTALGQLLAEKGDHFSQIILQADDRSYTLIAAAAGPQVNLRKVIHNSELNLPEDPHTLVKGLYLNTTPQLINSDAKLAPTAFILNQVIGGSLHAVTGESENLTTAAFRTHNTWAAALVSTNSKPVEVVLTFPSDGRTIPTYALTLNGDEVMKEPIRREGQTITATIPANGLIVLTSDAVTTLD